MQERKLTYFVADVHLGCDVLDPADREARFVGFLRSLPPETGSVYLLGDIWDFWYEYRDVVPKGYVRVFSTIMDLIDRDVDVYFFRGNHDVWSYSYFESLGMKRLEQPFVTTISGKVFCLGHGDGLGPVPGGYRILSGIFHCRPLQKLFSTIHPWIAFRLGNSWSKNNRLKHKSGYVFRDGDEPLYRFAEEFGEKQHVDYFIFGHFHTSVNLRLPCGAVFRMVKDWFRSSPYLVWDGEELRDGKFIPGSSPVPESAE